MTKGEIKGLQGLALAHGGSLSINPDTGLVEASFLKRILPMVAGAGLAMIPGVSRSGASIVGGMSQKLSRTTAAEFSFFLAVPTMLGATVKKCYDYYKAGFVLSDEQVNLLIIGNVVGFIVAMIAIKSFIGFLSKNGFKLFGYYRIVAGIAVLLIHFFVQKLTII
jgi:undecaprenyl-diphosphatase